MKSLLCHPLRLMAGLCALLSAGSAFAATPIQWTVGPSLPSPRADAAALRMPDGKIFLIGGSSGNVTADVASLGIGDTSWTKQPRLDQARIGMGVGALTGGRIAVFGGADQNAAILGSTVSYDPTLKSNNATPLAAMITARRNFGFATDTLGRHYAIGGISATGVTASMEMFNPATNTWSARAPLPQALSKFVAVSDGGDHLYAFGGVSSANTPVSTSYRYSISTNQWTAVAPMVSPQAIPANAAIHGHDDKIYVVTAGLSVQVYHIVGDFWTVDPSPPNTGAAAAAMDTTGRLVVMGGTGTNKQPLLVSLSQILTEPQGIPAFVSLPSTTTGAGGSFIYRAIAEGAPHASYSLIGQPTGMTIDAVSGLISWIPSFAQIGTWKITVRASNVYGHTDQIFNLSVIGPTPATPIGLTLTNIGETTVSLKWNPITYPAGPVTYRILVRRLCGRCGSIFDVAVDNIAGTSATVTGLTPGVTRMFFVVAVGGGVQSPLSLPVTATPLQPATPASLTATTVTQNSVTLFWQATVGPIPIVGYRVYEAGLRLQDNIKVLTARINALLPGTTHVYEVRAFDASGFESKGAFVTVTTLAPPTIAHTPLYVAERVVAVVSEPMMVIAATTPLTSSVGFPYTVSATGTPTPTYSIVSGPAGMAVNPSTGALSWVPGVGTPAGISTVTVRASNSEGFADLKFTVTAFAAGTDLLVPTNVPTYQTLTNVTRTGASFTWVPATDNKGVVGYNIYSQTPPTNCARGAGCSGGPVVKVGVAGANASYTITGLAPGTAYAIYFQAFDAAGNVANEPLGTVLPLLRLNTLP